MQETECKLLVNLYSSLLNDEIQCMFSHLPLNAVTSKIIDKLSQDFFVIDDSMELEALRQADITPLPKAPSGLHYLPYEVLLNKYSNMALMFPKYPLLCHKNY